MAGRSSESRHPRPLRVAVLRGRTVLVERVIPASQDVTMGATADCALVVPDAAGPAVRLFRAGRDDHRLELGEGRDGQLVDHAGTRSLAALRARRGGGAVPLAEDARGRLELGSLTVLFQRVAVPPHAAPPDFRPRLLDEDDPVFLGFLTLHAALAAALMVRVLATEPVALVAAGELPDRFASVFLAAPPTADATTPPPAEQVRPEAEVARRTEPAPARARSPEQAAAARAAAAVARRGETIRRSRLLEALIGADREPRGRTVDDLLAREDLHLARLDEALQRVDGAEVASLDAASAPRGASQGRTWTDAGIGDLARGATDAGARVGAGPGSAPPARILEEPATDRPAGAAEAWSFRRYHGQIRACYEGELKLRPTLRGRVVLTVQVESGRVASVDVDDRTGSAGLEACLARRARQWRLPDDLSGELVSVFVLEPAR